MATLYVRDVPDDLYLALRVDARDSGRSIGAQAIAILGEHVPKRPASTLTDMAEAADRVRALSEPVKDTARTADLIRADRDR